MNERIRELVKQANIKYSTRDDDFYSAAFDGVHRPDMERFVESIVRECADICINENVSILDMNVIRESGKFTLQDLATKSCGENLSKQIKKHFGVEE